MKYEEMINQIIEQVGGKQNITSAVHCMTRLRINYKDKSAINVENIKNIKGVLGAQFSGAQFQIIIGQTVSDVYKEFCEIVGIGAAAAIDENLDKEPFNIKQVPGKVLDAVSGSIAPILPIMMAAGFFKLFYALLGSDILGIVPNESDIMQIFYIIGNAGFYFMPVFIAWGAAKKFNTSIPLAVLLGTLLVDPNILNIVAAGEPFKMYNLIPMPLNNYTQTLVPILLTVWILSYVYKFFDAHMPKAIKVIGTPFCTVAVMVPIMFCALAPIGNWIAMGLAQLISLLYDVAGPLCISLIAGTWMYCVATGMHIAIVQIAIMNLTTLGFDPIVLAGSNLSTYALMGMIVAYFIRTKGEEKEMAGANAVTLIVGGISEPTLFGVLLRNTKAMISYTIGGLVGGLVGGILKVKVYVFATSNILTVLGYAGPGNNLIYAIIAAVIAFGVSLAVGLVLGFEQKK